MWSGAFFIGIMVKSLFLIGFYQNGCFTSIVVLQALFRKLFRVLLTLSLSSRTKIIDSLLNPPPAKGGVRGGNKNYLLFLSSYLHRIK